MVGSGSQSQSQSQPQPPSAEEEALKRNTDCVYFLASPLTCKKGSDCEYRHSEVARVNPRDCYFWLHGNCLNPKCGFRHPPLDGLLGTQKPTPTGSSAPVPLAAAAPIPQVPNSSTKQGPPCIYFQKGYCLKGDWCSFPHVLPSFGNKGTVAPGTGTTAEPAAIIKKTSIGLDKSVQEKNALPVNVAKSVKVPSQAKQIVEVKPTPAPLRNELVVNRRVTPTSGITEFPGYTRDPYASNGIQERWSGHIQQPHLFDDPESNNKDAEELSREPSPGFDVLVDDENRESDYYPGDDRYGMSHEAGIEYDMDRATDSNMIAVEDERYQDSIGYDSHDHRKGQYTWDQHKRSSERMSGGSYTERRPYDRTDNLGQADQFDLRHRLSKHKRANGLRSVINHEHARDQHAGDRNYQGLHRDEQHIPLRESTRSGRLQGRISLPGTDRSRVSSRLSPGRANISSSQVRIQDRIKGRVDEAFNNGGKFQRGPHTRGDIAGDNSINFAGPKSLAELKNKRSGEPMRQHTTDQHLLGKRKSSLDDPGQTENDLSFEGPKPLEEILKRKRGETVGPINGGSSSNHQHIIEAANQDGTNATKNEVSKSALAPDSILQSIASKVEAEDGEHPETRAGQESVAYDQRGGEDEYDQFGGEDLYTYDGENGDADADATGEYNDEEDDDDDDFAKKMGVMYS